MPLKHSQKLSLAKMSAATDSNSHITGNHTLQYFLFEKFFFIFQTVTGRTYFERFFYPLITLHEMLVF